MTSSFGFNFCFDDSIAFLSFPISTTPPSRPSSILSSPFYSCANDSKLFWPLNDNIMKEPSELSSFDDNFDFNFIDQQLITNIDNVLGTSSHELCSFEKQVDNETCGNNDYVQQMNKSKIRKIVARNLNYYRRYGWTSIELIEPTSFIDNSHQDFTNEYRSTPNDLVSNNLAVKTFPKKSSENVRGKQVGSGKNKECSFCKNLPPEKRANYKDHWLKDNQKRVTCPILRAYNCPQCNNGGGDNAHTTLYCPLNRQRLAKSFQIRAQIQQQHQLKKFATKICLSPSNKDHHKSEFTEGDPQKFIYNIGLVRDIWNKNNFSSCQLK